LYLRIVAVREALRALTDELQRAELGAIARLRHRTVCAVESRQLCQRGERPLTGPQTRYEVRIHQSEDAVYVVLWALLVGLAMLLVALFA
jgi:hypothetical protein